MKTFLDIELLPYLEEIADICIGNESPESVGAGELSTLPEILSLIQYNQANKEYLKHGIRKVKIIEDKLIFMREQLELLQRKQEYGLENKE